MNTVEPKEAERLSFEMNGKEKIMNETNLSNTSGGFMKRILRKTVVTTLAVAMMFLITKRFA